MERNCEKVEMACINKQEYIFVANIASSLHFCQVRRALKASRSLSPELSLLNLALFRPPSKPMLRSEESGNGPERRVLKGHVRRARAATIHTRSSGLFIAIMKIMIRRDET